MHDDWVRQIDLELDGELSLTERAALARHLATCRPKAEALIGRLLERYPEAPELQHVRPR
ncbi:MAG: zf-HC2 domain-containing protein [Gemmatimonadetes bacterium]|nr:MAG: zf-HC2 domain-containing protein [Gemmatimonadota bacterium]